MPCVPDPIVPRTPCLACPNPDDFVDIPKGFGLTTIVYNALQTNLELTQCLADNCGLGGGGVNCAATNACIDFTALSAAQLGAAAASLVSTDATNTLILGTDGLLQDPPVTFTVESGTTAVVGDAANGTELITEGDTIHFWSSDASVDINVTAGSAVVDIKSSGVAKAAVAPVGAAEGDVYYNTTDNTLYAFDGAAWVPVGGATSSVVSLPAAPAGPAAGDVYYNTTDNRLYYYDGTAWVPVDTASALTTAAAAPAGAVAGDVYYNTTDNTAYVYDGTNWVPLSEDEVVENAGPLAGAAPAFAKLGVDTTTGQLYYVAAGTWTAAPIAAVDLNSTYGATQVAAYAGGAPVGAPAAPDNGDLFIQGYTTSIEVWVAAGGAFAGASNVSIPIGSATNLYGADGALAAARTVSMAGNSLTLDGTGDIVFGDNGSITFNNALLPGGLAGTAGQGLLSSGAGVTPVWGDVVTSLTVTSDTTALGVTAGGTATAPTIDVTILSTDANNDITTGSDGGVYYSDPISGVTDLANGLDIVLNAELIEVSYDFTELAAAPAVDEALDRLVMYDTSAATHSFVNPDQLATVTTYTTDSTALGVTVGGTALAPTVDLVVLSTDANNDITTGSDGGVYYSDPVSGVNDLANGLDIALTAELIEVSYDFTELVAAPAVDEALDRLIMYDTSTGTHSFVNPDQLATVTTYTTDGTALGVTTGGTALAPTLDVTVLSTDANNNLSTGSDGGVFYNDPIDGVNDKANGLDVTINAENLEVDYDFSELVDLTTADTLDTALDRLIIYNTSTGAHEYINPDVLPSGGLVETLSGGATILHDGSAGPGSLPTYVDTTGGSGTLVSNGNKIVSVKGTFNTTGGAYSFNHDNPSGIVLSAAYLAANGVSPGGRNPRITSPTLHQWAGLTGDNPHHFIWSF